MNIRIPIEHIKTDSFTVQWDPVTDIFPITYTVQWYGGDIDNTANTSNLSYTVTGLTSNTSYNVTVVAINTCCGAGNVSNVVVVTTMNVGVVMTATTSDNIAIATPSTSPPSNISGMQVNYS